MAIVQAQRRSKVVETPMIAARGGEEHAALDQVGKDCEVVLSFADVHLVHSDPDHFGEIQNRVGIANVRPQQTPQTGIALAEDLPGPRHRHLPHQGQGERLELLGEVLTLALPGRRNRPNLVTPLATSPRQRAENFGSLPEGIQMPPSSRFGVVVADHRRPFTGTFRTLQTRPEPLGLLHHDQKTFRRLGLVLRGYDRPPIIQLQQPSKCLLGNHASQILTTPSATGNSEEPKNAPTVSGWG